MSSPAHSFIDLPTGRNQTLRIAIVDDGEGGPVLILAHGFGTGDGFHRPGYCGLPLRLPVDVLPELRKALEVLGDQDPPA